MEIVKKPKITGIRVEAAGLKKRDYVVGWGIVKGIKIKTDLVEVTFTNGCAWKWEGHYRLFVLRRPRKHKL